MKSKAKVEKDLPIFTRFDCASWLTTLRSALWLAPLTLRFRFRNAQGHKRCASLLSPFVIFMSLHLGWQRKLEHKKWKILPFKFTVSSLHSKHKTTGKIEDNDMYGRSRRISWLDINC